MRRAEWLRIGPSVLAAAAVVGWAHGVVPVATAQPLPTEDVVRGEYHKQLREAYQTPAAIQPRPDEELLNLMQERYHNAQRDLWERLMACSIRSTGVELEALFTCLKRVTESELVLSRRPEDRPIPYERAVKLTRAVEMVTQYRVKQGRATEQDVELCRYHRLDWQIKFLEAKRKLEPKDAGKERK